MLNPVGQADRRQLDRTECNVLGLTLHPKVLKPSYLLRIILLRTVFVCLGAIDLDSAWAVNTGVHHISDGSSGSSQGRAGWGWPSRLGLVALLAPLLCNLWGVLWPLVQLSSFEKHYNAFQRVVLYVTVVGKVVSQLTGIAGTSGSYLQDLVVHGLLFAVHQEYGHEAKLAFMLLAYCTGHTLSNAATLLPCLTTWVLGSAHSSSSSSSNVCGKVNPSVDIALGCKWFVLAYGHLVVINQLYCWFYSERERPRSVRVPGSSVNRNVTLSRPPSCGGGSSSSSKVPYRSSRATLVDTDIQHSSSSSSSRPACWQSVAQKVLAIKLSAVQGCIGGCMGLYGLELLAWRHHTVALGSASTEMSVGSLWLGGPALVCGLAAVVHAAVLSRRPLGTQRQQHIARTWSLVRVMGLHLWLIWRQSVLAASPGSGWAPVAPENAFHGFILAACTVGMHDDPVPWFAAQLTCIGFVFRQLHFALLQGDPGRFADMPASHLLHVAADSLYELPEYGIMTIGSILVYNWLMHKKQPGSSSSSCPLPPLKPGAVPQHNARRSIAGAAEVSESKVHPAGGLLSGAALRPPKLSLDPEPEGVQSSPEVGLSTTELGLMSPSRPRRAARRSVLMTTTFADTPEEGSSIPLSPGLLSSPSFKAVLQYSRSGRWNSEDGASSGSCPASPRLSNPPWQAGTSRDSSQGGNNQQTQMEATSTQPPPTKGSSTHGLLGRVQQRLQLLLGSIKVVPGRVAAAPGDQTAGAVTAAAAVEGAAAEADEGLALMLEQRVACDALLNLMFAPIDLKTASVFIKAAISPSVQLGFFRWCAGCVIAAAFTMMVLAHVGYVLMRPYQAVVTRNTHWAAHMGLLSMICNAGYALFQLPPQHSPRITMLILAAGFGMLDLPVASFFTWLPLLVVSNFLPHAWMNRSTITRSWLLTEAAEYNLSPLVTYMVYRWLNNSLLRLFVRLVLGLFRSLGGKRFTNRQRLWTKVAAMLAQAVISNLLIWILLQGPIHLPAGMDPFAALEAIKQSLMGMLSRMDVKMDGQLDAVHTMVAVIGVGLCFAIMSGVQAYILNNPALRNPRQVWYEEHKARLSGLGEHTMGRLAALKDKPGPTELRATLLISLMELTEGCFPGCSLLLVLLEDCSLESGLAQRYVLQAAPEAADLPQQQQMLLSELASVEQVCRKAKPVFKSAASGDLTGYGDLEHLADSCGMDGFLVVPLACAGQDQGALLVTSRAPVLMDRHMRKLASDLGHALSQTLYTLSCIGQMRAGEQILHDMLPEQVAEQLRRRVIHGNAARTFQKQGSISGSGDNPESILQKLSEAASTLQLQQEQLKKEEAQVCQLGMLRAASASAEQSTASSMASVRKGRVRRASACSPIGVAVVYKQWHPAVSVLFADISSYTAMSQQVEPEQVMMLLHELFSKYDNLCSRYGIYKVETIGDCYMACSGLLVDNPDHARHLVEFGQAMLGVAASVPHPLGGSVHIRVGVHSGRVMSGIVGSIRARYCLFGDTVNTASRMESTGVVDHIQISEDTYQLLGELQSDFDLREAVAVKGKGVMNTYVLREDVSERLRGGG